MLVDLELIFNKSIFIYTEGEVIVQVDVEAALILFLGFDRCDLGHFRQQLTLLRFHRLGTPNW